MKIDTDAFLDSLPIMGNGLLGIFIVTGVLIIGIYILRALTAKKAESDAAKNATTGTGSDTAAGGTINAATGTTTGAATDTSSPALSTQNVRPNAGKESAMDLMREKEKKDFLESDDTFTISNDL
jgi:hypothetical protein